MKRILFYLAASLICCLSAAQTHWYDGYEMGLGGKLLPTENPYHRIDTSRYTFVNNELNLVRCRRLIRAFRSFSSVPSTGEIGALI